MVPIVTKLNIIGLKEMTPYFSGDGHRRFGATCYHFYLEEGSSMFLQNFGTYLPNYTASCPKRVV